MSAANEKLFSGDAAKWLIEEVAKRGVDASRTLSGTGLGEQWLNDSEAVLTGRQYHRLLTNAMAETRDPALGLIAAQQTNYVSRFGFWGYAILSSSTFRQASAIALRYWEVSGSIVRLQFHDEGDACAWEIFPVLAPMDLKVLVFGVEKVISSSLATITFATGSPPPVREILVTYPPPEHAALYTDYWKAPVRFNQKANLVRMDSKVLERPLIMANPQVMEVCKQQCRQLLSSLRRSDELVELIRRLIVGSPGNFPPAGQMARKLGMSPRTLRRRLGERGTTYMAVLNEVRAELATGYLTATALSIDEIAGLLGYAETTTFRRSFKKWTGRSAAEVRKQTRETLKTKG